MTEDEAKTRWCPMVRSLYSSAVFGVGLNRGLPNNSAARCCGSSCMMWRWTLPGYKEASTAQGYCGLGGKP